jgi:protease I
LKLRNLVNEASKKRKVVGAICLAPVILARAGLLVDQQATMHRNKTTFREFNLYNVHYIPEDVVVHDNIVMEKVRVLLKNLG